MQRFIVMDFQKIRITRLFNHVNHGRFISDQDLETFCAPYNSAQYCMIIDAIKNGMQKNELAQIFESITPAHDIAELLEKYVPNCDKITAKKLFTELVPLCE